MRICDRCKQEVWEDPVSVGLFRPSDKVGTRFYPLEYASYDVDACKTCVDTFLKPLIAKITVTFRGNLFNKPSTTVEEAGKELDQLAQEKTPKNG